MFGYVRVSTETQVLDGEGLDVQREKLREYAEANSLDLIEVIEDPGVSGTTAFYERPGLSSLLELCKKNDVHTVLIAKYDRLARSLQVQLYAEMQFMAAGIEFVSVSEGNLNGSDPMMVAFRQIVGVFAELERGRIVSRLADGRRHKVSRGCRAGGALPYGYRYSEDGKAVLIAPEQAKIVCEMFKLAPRWRGNDLAAKLNSRGYRAPRGGEWSSASVENILHNPFYIGKIRLIDGTEIQGQHEPILTLQEWEDAR